MTDATYGPYGPIEEPPWSLTPPFEDEDPSMRRDPWETAETHRNRVRARKTRVLVEALDGVELSDYEVRCLGWVACWETHMVATLAVLLRRSYKAGQWGRVGPNCNDNCNDADQKQGS